MPLNGAKRKENKMSKFKRIVFFGGTFDPWTPAHEEIALKLSETPNTLVVVTPTAITRHRDGKEPLYSACKRSLIIWHRIGKCEPRHESSKFTINDHELSLLTKRYRVYSNTGVSYRQSTIS
jgi:nicotinic acid mononucleotide adenylyltransferase